MVQAACPRCGEAGPEGLCGRCTAYLLRFDPFVLRPGLPGPPIDREVRRGVALLTFDPEEPVRIAPPSPPRTDDAYARQFLAHIGLPDGGKAVLTRGDREFLHRILRKWAREPPTSEEGRELARRLYSEFAALPEMPAEGKALFESLAGGPQPGPPEIVEVSVPPPVPEPEPKLIPPPTEEPSIPLPLPSQPPPPPDEIEARVLQSLRDELSAKKEELARWLADRQADMDRRQEVVQAQIDELRAREAAIQEKERVIVAEERSLQEHALAAERRAAEAGATEKKRALFFLLFSMEGVSRKAAKALAESFPTEEGLRSATVEELASVPEVPPEEAALIRDAFTGGEAPPRRDLREKATEMLEEGRHAEALEVFDELVRLNPEDTESWLNRAEVLAILGRNGEAVAAYERVLELDPENRSAHGELANLLFEEGEYGLAAANLVDLLRRAPDQELHWLGRASELLSERRPTEATLIYNAILEADPQNLPAGLALGDLLLAMGDVERADSVYTQALQAHPDSPEALLKKGLLLNEQGRWGAAIQLFNRAISLRWDYREAWEAKGQVLLAKDKPKEALETFDKILSFDEKLVDAWIGKAEAHLALGDKGGAAKAAERARTLDANRKEVAALLERIRTSPVPAKDVASSPPPDDAFDEDILLEMADALLQAGDAPAALRGFDEVLTMDPRNARAVFGKGRSLHSLERYEEALRCFTEAKEIEPKNEEYAKWVTVCRERLYKEGR